MIQIDSKTAVLLLNNKYHVFILLPNEYSIMFYAIAFYAILHIKNLFCK